MIKKWLPRIVGLILIALVITVTRDYYYTYVVPYSRAKTEQELIWAQKAQANKERAEQKAKEEAEAAKQKEEAEAKKAEEERLKAEEEKAKEEALGVSEATGDDFYLNLSHFSMWESGEFGADDGQKADNKRRLRYKEMIPIECPEYFVKLTQGFSLVVFEYDSDEQYIRHQVYSGGNIYKASKNAASFSVVLYRDDNEKSLSLGQWAGIFSDEFEVIICTEQYIDGTPQLTGKLITGSYDTLSAEEMADMLLDGRDDELAYELWKVYVTNGTYSLNYEDLNSNRITYFVSDSEGNDSNSGLSIDSPKKSFDSFSGMSDVNILLKCGDTFNITKEFKTGSNSLYAAYGEGERPVISLYRNLEVSFVPFEGYDDLWVAALNDMDICTNDGTKDNCNIGQLSIDGEINWNRLVWSSKDIFDPDALVAHQDNAWAVDWLESKLYICSQDNPNNKNILFAPASNGFTLKKVRDVEIKGIKITGAGRHGCNITDCENVKISDCYFSNIGGSVLRQAGIRFGNAIQIWDSGKNIEITNNYCAWIFDTCFTNQGSKEDALEENVLFANNIGAHFFWGIETWGDGYSDKGFENIVYKNNILYDNIDITNPKTKMHAAENTRLLGVQDKDYISYRGGYKYHQMSSINISNSGIGECVRVENNFVWNSNRFMILAYNSRNEDIMSSLRENYFYSETDSEKACLLRVTIGKEKKYYKSIESVFDDSNTWVVNVGCDHKYEMEAKSFLSETINSMIKK